MDSREDGGSCTRHLRLCTAYEKRVGSVKGIAVEVGEGLEERVACSAAHRPRRSALIKGPDRAPLRTHCAPFQRGANWEVRGMTIRGRNLQATLATNEGRAQARAPRDVEAAGRPRTRNYDASPPRSQIDRRPPGL